MPILPTSPAIQYTLSGVERIGSISAPYKLKPLTIRGQSPQFLLQIAAYPTEFEDQPPSHSALAHSQAHLSMPLDPAGPLGGVDWPYPLLAEHPVIMRAYSPIGDI